MAEKQIIRPGGRKKRMGAPANDLLSPSKHVVADGRVLMTAPADKKHRVVVLQAPADLAEPQMVEKDGKWLSKNGLTYRVKGL